ncbi:hypothetical protein WMY93_024272 [Mugilogobius chulae]|uniref:L1 transposable element RRM domain-containing protein n=1 Tax=Mugilogobius chulae TaxID=88201 RepID=A0AAW0N988_9GOBI
MSKIKAKHSTKQLGSETNEPHEESMDTMGELLKQLKEFRSETASNFEVLKCEMSDLRKDLGEITKRMDNVEQRLSESEDSGFNVTRVMFQMLQAQKVLADKCEDLENRHRRNNIRIYSVPEKTEGSDMIDFVTNLLRDKLEVTAELQIERAHRALARAPAPNERPRSIIVQFRSYITKQHVLKTAWMKKTVLLNGQRIFFDEDFSPAVFKERGKYKDVRKLLCERKIKSHILFPARLKIFLEDGKAKVYENPSVAAQGLRDFGIMMDVPSEEPDLDSLLRTAGWHSAGANRKTPANEMMEAVKSLLDRHNKI